MASSQENALHTKTPDVIDAVAAGGWETISTLAEHLVAEGLITQVVDDEAIDAKSTRDGVRKLVRAVKGKVKLNPERNFGMFLTALRKSELKDVAEMLEKECCELWGNIVFLCLRKI